MMAAFSRLARRLARDVLLCATVFAGVTGSLPANGLQSSTGMVVTSQHLASDVGAAILRQGGNAIDAAVAVGYALAVTHPCCGNLGGGGFMLIHLASGKDVFINFRERAPGAATADMFLDAKGKPVPDRSLDGWLGVGVPGTVLGLETARAAYGTMSRAALIEPAVGLAENGIILEKGDVDTLAEGLAAFRRQPNVAAIFLNGDRPFAPGDRLVQKDLAVTLRAIQAGGPDAFYRGPIADRLVDASLAGGGLLTHEDLASYTVEQMAPVRCAYRGYTVLSAPPPSSGGVTLCEMLQILEGYPLGAWPNRSAQEVHVMTEAMRLAYFDRNTYLGDPDFVTNPVERLTSPAYAKSLQAKITPGQATASATLGAAVAPPEHATTTHYSIVDRLGNAVSVTYTINDDFGAKVIAPGTGFFLNDEMDDFTAKPGVANNFGLVQGKANAIAPGKRPLSSMTPTIILKDGHVVLVVGSPGGARIITTVLETIVDVIDHHMPLQAAVDAPRFHHQWLPDTLAAEPDAISAHTQTALQKMGYDVVPLQPWGTGNSEDAVGVAPHDPGAAQALGFPAPDLFYGANDMRAPAGSAAAP